jgi:hypothetical protein
MIDEEDLLTYEVLEAISARNEHMIERLEYPWWLEPDPWELLELTTEVPEPPTPAEPEWFIAQWNSYRDWCARTGN